MLVLLPPSEGKAEVSARGRPLDLDRLSFTDLTPTRVAVLGALVQLCAGPPDAARSALGLTPGQLGELDRNRQLLTAATRPVEALYTGVLYDALALSSLSAGARRRARSWVVVSTALLGAVRLTDRVPSHRLAMSGRLPGMGPLAATWRSVLDPVLTQAAGGGLVVDLRSSDYAATWRPAGAVAARTVTVRVLHEARPGDPTSRTVVSHFNKATKGRLLRDLLESGVTPRTAAAAAGTLSELGHRVELGPPGPRGHALDVVVTDG